MKHVIGFLAVCLSSLLMNALGGAEYSMAIAPLIIGGAAALGGILGAKGNKQTTDISKAGQGYRDWYMQQMQRQSGMPLQFYGVDGYKAGGVGGGRFSPPPTFEPGQDPYVAGLGGLWGDGGYVNQFLNPYQQSMEESMGRTFGRQRDALGRQVDDLATRDRAFGGTRSIVANRIGQRDINESEADTLARFNYQGYNDALGYGLQERGIQQGQRQNEIDAARSRFDQAQQWPMAMLDRFGQGFSQMPWGQTSQSGGGLGGFIQGAIGGGLTAYGMGNPGYSPAGAIGRNTPQVQNTTQYPGPVLRGAPGSFPAASQYNFFSRPLSF
jgi:hypothetical protein